jgi:hypothetical protein
VTAERREQADLLATLRPDQWDAPTLCVGRVNRVADRCARRDAARMTSDQLLASLRDNVAHGWKPPGGGALGALSHDVIHGLDITVGLGLGRRTSPDRVAMVLAG